MALVALTDDEEVRYASEVDPDNREDCYFSLKDSYPMHFVNASSRVNHFRRNPDYSKTGSGGGGGPAESSIHERRKKHALAHAKSQFEHKESALEERLNGKQPDAKITFAEPHDRYGNGFAIEYQHKNSSKDIDASASAFAEAGYTTVVLRDKHFPEEMSGVPDIDFFGGRVTTPLVGALPDDAHAMSPYESVKVKVNQQTDWTRRRTGTLRDTNSDRICEAPLPVEWHAKQTRKLWENNSWVKKDLFSETVFNELRTELASKWPAKCRSLSDDSNPIVPATVPGEYLCQRAGWEWLTVLTEYPEREFVAQAVVPDEPVSTVVPATFPDKWRWERAGEILTTVGPVSEFKPDVHCESHLPDNPEYARIPVSVPNSIKLSELVQDQNIPDPDRPSNPFNDVQCRVCGMYWHYTKEHHICPDCGRPVDWQWNVQTHRIDDNVVPDTATGTDSISDSRP